MLLLQDLFQSIIRKMDGTAFVLKRSNLRNHQTDGLEVTTWNVQRILTPKNSRTDAHTSLQNTVSGGQ